ncbi:MAG TPA: hypothetical protein VFZ77_12365 [Acidimicrobiales bacterium]
MSDPDPFESAYWAARGRARLTSTGDLLRTEARLRRDHDRLGADELTQWAAVRSVLAERDIELPPIPDPAA